MTGWVLGGLVRVPGLALRGFWVAYGGAAASVAINVQHKNMKQTVNTIPC